MAGPTVTVQVAVRIRPGNEHDLTHIPARFQKTVVHAQNGTTVAVDAIPATNTGTGTTAPPPKKQVFTFDQAHGPGTSQHQLFTTTAAPLVDRFVQGFNCTVLAYGQTSSGKTYTMSGVDLDGDPSDPDNGMGVIPRAVATIFAKARELKEERGAAWQCTIKASFIELYNEDLIDLLSDGRREVQIREDKDGNIIWGGLREVPVKNVADVLNLLRQGTSLRRTNETDMNAQSSRSHAIFSLTLVQKKYTGSAPLPRISLQAPASAGGGRTSPLPSPSRLNRPGSMFVGGKDNSGRVSSPTFGRPSTPSFASALGRGSGIRPASAMALRPSAANRPGTPDEDEKAGASGEWVSVVSKFHFVDLAGSERLKRTAAQGDRVKEGISINGGLLALGNVISALGDPSKSRAFGGHVHVPYRDSKLTRLLQDSLGGNAHTLMIACVSPAEYNAAETINTLKYANRARNIRNRAEIKEKEEGWEDLEWLQGQVSKLRKEVKALKDGGAVASSGGTAANAAETEAKERELQMLQTEYDDMRLRLAGTSEELARLRLTLEDRGGATGGAGKYEEIVAPVIEEYEKQISHMETQIKLQKTAVRHTENELADKEAELEEIQKRANQADNYIEELRLRLGKATEQERSRESYVRDLEQQIKNFTESSSSTSGTLVELQRELSRYKETEGTNAHYISELEGRLARQDKDVESLRNDMAKLERELAQSRERCKTMDSLVETLRAEREAERKDREEWSKILEAREKKVEELETRMAEVEKMRTELQSERERLGNAVGGVERARRSIEFTAPTTNGSGEALVVVEELEQLRKQHADTLQELNTVNSRYQDALHDISDLYAQINEAKLQAISHQPPPVPPLPSTEPSSADEIRSPTPTSRRRAGSRAALDSPVSRPSRGTDSPSQKRVFFRHAASSESLHARSQSQSVSLSQELSSARSPKSLFANGSENSEGSEGNGIRKLGHRSQLSLTIPSERSAEDLEKEIHELQAILRTREAEIVALETTIKENEREASFRALSSGTEVKVNGTYAHVNGDFNPRDSLSPDTMRDFAEIRKSLQVLPSKEDGVDASLNRLDELMRSMAKKESQHRELVDGLNVELEKLRKQHEDLTTLSRDQTHNMSMEMDALKTRLSDSDEKHSSITAELEQIRLREQELQDQIRLANESHASEIANLKAEHAVELERKETALSTRIAELQSTHETALAQAAALLATTRHEYAESLGAMQSENDDDLRKQAQEHEAAIAAIKGEYQAKLEELRAGHAAALSAQTAESEAASTRMHEEHQAAIERLKVEHSETLSRAENEGAVALQRLKDEHTAVLKQLDIARQGTSSESTSSQVLIIQQLQGEHAAAIARKEAAIKEDMESAKAEHARILKRREDEHEASLKAAVAKHEAALEDLRKAHSIELERISTQLQEAATAHASTLEQLRATHEEALRRKTQEHAGVLNEKELSYQHSFAQLKASHQAELAAIQLTLVSNQVEHKDALDSTIAERDEQLSRLREEYEQKVAQLQEVHGKDKTELHGKYEAAVAELEGYKTKLEALRVQEPSVANAESAHQTALDKLGRELGEMTENRATLSAEVETLRAQLEEARSQQASHSEESTKHQAAVNELEREREAVSSLQSELHKAAEEREALEAEKNKQDALIKELLAQLATKAATPEPPEDQHRAAPRMSEGGRNMAYTRANGLPPAKLPPLTPPPSIPPPPVPTAVPPVPSIDSATIRTGTTSISSQADSTAESSIATSQAADPNTAAQLEKQAKQLEEAQTMIKTLNKQLTHCEGDLQAHMDLVATLETSLSDSERNLRKSRSQSMELVKERDSLLNQVQGLRAQLEEAQNELTQVRRTVVEEKHSLEQRLDDERRAKDRARQQLESRMEELQRRKSKFACI